MDIYLKANHSSNHDGKLDRQIIAIAIDRYR